jgi:hypothetical protein
MIRIRATNTASVHAWIRLATIAGGVMLLTGRLTAGNPPSEQGPCLADQWGPPGARIFAKLDPEATGWVDAEHFVAHRARRFADFAADGEGWVTWAEYQRMHPGLSTTELLTRYRRLDQQGVGRFSQDDWNAAQFARFQRIDANADGVVTRDEFLAERERRCALREAAARP